MRSPSVIRTRGRAPASPAVLLWVLSLLWGAAFPVQKAMLQHMGPAWVAALRALIAAVVLLPVWFSSGPRLGRRGHLLAAASGLCNVSIFFGLQAAGLHHAAPGAAAALIFTQPIMVLVLGHVLLGEIAGARSFAAASLCVTGVALITWKGGSLPVFGLVLLLLAACGGAVGSVILRKGRHLPTWRLVSAQSAYGSIPLCVAAPLSGQALQITGGLWAGALYLGAGATALGWWLLAVSLRERPAWEVSASLAWTPVVAAALGVLTGQEILTWAGGAGLMLLGVGTIITAKCSGS